MSFNSITFFVFILILFPVLRSTTNHKFRKMELLFASYVFYGWWDWRFCGLLFLVTYIAYVCGTKVYKYPHKKIYLKIGVIFPLIILGVFKYLNFFIDSFQSLFGIENVGGLTLILPVGISFYTFQAISFVVDVYRKNIDNIEKYSFLDICLYISFFPQLVAGPIIKAKDFLPQLREDRNVNLRNLEVGVQIFALGMFKKVVLADHIAVFVDEIYEIPSLYSGMTVFLALLAYSVQIYCDFSGYSEMAIGCAKCMGYNLKKNFDLPYISKNVTEFWRRWHISLSTWLKEYLYIPLGGNRHGTVRTYINLFLTMVLGGMWHGANWTYLIWGAIHGLALCIHKFFMRIKSKNNENADIVNLIFIVCNFIFVSFVWVFFRANNLHTAKQIFEQVFLFKSGISHYFVWAFIGIAFVIIEALITNFKLTKKFRFVSAEGFLDLNSIKGVTIFFVFIGLILGLAYIGENPFIYFQF